MLEERYPRLSRSQPLLGGARGHRQALDALRSPAGAEFDASLAPCLEAQIVDFADEIAYNAHDIDDGLKSGMLDPDELAHGAALGRRSRRSDGHRAEVRPSTILRYQAVRRLIDGW